MDLLDALHRRLTAATVAASENEGRDLTIADLYQRLIPYRTVRHRLGVMELAEYEQALLRLLGGERDYVEVTDSAVREEIQRELASPNPILGIYRDYPEAVVRLIPAGAVARPPREATLMPPVSSASGAARPKRVEPPPPSTQGPDRSAPRPAVAATGDLCAHCHKLLPALQDLLYCPYCGGARAPQPCVRCGTMLEGEWMFCIRCGSDRSGKHSRRNA